MRQLKEGQVYYIDGGYFQAKYNAERAFFELWTYMGLSGYVIARTGFEIDEQGRLYHRVYDVEAEEHVLIDGGYTVGQLEEVDI